MPWLRKHNPQIDWNDLSIQLSATLRAMYFEPETKTGFKGASIEVLPRDEMDWVGSPPDDPNTILEDAQPQQTTTQVDELRWDEPAQPKSLNSKQRKR
ncbi:hypothetical protein K525DRAFT_147038, partial [Schizophyllum commune Loenen D]